MGRAADRASRDQGVQQHLRQEPSRKGRSEGNKGADSSLGRRRSLDAKAAVLRLVDDLGFDPVDGGVLDNSWRQQPGTPAYCRDLEAAALRRALADADRSRIAEYRAEEEARIRRRMNI